MTLHVWERSSDLLTVLSCVWPISASASLSSLLVLHLSSHPLLATALLKCGSYLMTFLLFVQSALPLQEAQERARGLLCSQSRAQHGGAESSTPERRAPSGCGWRERIPGVLVWEKGSTTYANRGPVLHEIHQVLTELGNLWVIC